MSKKRDEKLESLKENGILNPSPEKVVDELFQKDDFFDSRDLVQVKYEMLRRVAENNYPVALAAQLFGLSRPTFYQVQRSFENGGLAGLLPRQRGPKAAHKLDDEVMAFIEQVLSRDTSLRPGKLAELIESKFSFTVHPRSIERALERRKKNAGNSPDS